MILGILQTSAFILILYTKCPLQIDSWSPNTDLDHLFESKRHQSWELRKIRRRIQPFRNEVFFGEARLLKSVHD